MNFSRKKAKKELGALVERSRFREVNSGGKLPIPRRSHPEKRVLSRGT